jgi:hypothetical protein
MEQPIVKSGILRAYPGQFVLDEDALRRFEATLTEATERLSFPVQIVFRVDREDDRFYETTKLADVLSDANLPGRRVDGIRIHLARLEQVPSGKPWEESWVARVSFYSPAHSRLSDSGVALEIVTDDRNWALLLADGIEPQILRIIKPRRLMIILAYAIPIAVLSALVFITGLLRYYESPATFPHPSLSVFWRVAIISPLIVFMVYVFRSLSFGKLMPDWFRRFVGTESVFLWGEELKLYPQRQRTRRNIFWGVMMAFLISLAASLLAWVLTVNRH